ncbi:MAG: glycosyltransferase family 9 protein [Burkholderiaceae bacterium]|nr:MAG: glycosyltransferase family 9 protein [Burkholderiaceae bacterium]
MALALNPARVLVIHVTRIGDTLMTSPALYAIAQAFPQAHLTFLGHPKRAELIENLPFISKVGKISKHSAPWRDRLSGRRWDVAFVYGYDIALVRYALRTCDRVLAFRQADPVINAQLHAIGERPSDNSMHMVDQFLLLPKLLGIKESGRTERYTVAPAEQKQATQQLALDTPHSARPLIGLVIESFPTKPYRDWHVSHFIELARKTLAHYPNAHFLLLGGKITAEKIASLQNALGRHMTVYAGRLSLRETAAIMQRLNLYIGVDTGPTHIAGALGIPMVALYHCMHPASSFRPLENDHCIALDHPNLGSVKCNEQSSMSEITTTQVWQAMQSILEGQGLDCTAQSGRY